ncbi:MAG: RNA polymerase sigma factor [Bacilli bacterium]
MEISKGKYEADSQMQEEEFIRLIKMYEADFYRIAYRYMQDENLALDMVSDSVLKAYRAMGSVKEPAYFKTWFIRILMNTCMNEIKKRKRETLGGELLEEVATDAPDVPTSITLHEAIDTLPPTEQTIIALRFFEDMKIESVAQMMELNPNTVKTKLYSALKKLKKMIGEV